jgi:protein involved in polysaccharide export with SLBB domain
MYRADPGLTVKVIPLDLEQILASPRGEKDLLLTDRDHIFIREQAEGVEKRTVTISGRVRYPGEYAFTAEERLSSVLVRAGGFLPEAFPKGAVFTRASVRQKEQQQLDKFIRAQEQALLAESAAVAAGAAEVSTPEAASAQAAITAQRREMLRMLAASIIVGRLAIHIESLEKLKGSPDDILLEDGDSLFIPQQPSSVAILGAVRSPTSVLYKEKENIDYYVARAGGATREADLDQTYILMADGSAVASFVKLRNIGPGDTIVVPVSTEPRYRTIPLVKDLVTIVGQFAIPVGVIAALLK